MSLGCTIGVLAFPKQRFRNVIPYYFTFVSFEICTVSKYIINYYYTCLDYNKIPLYRIQIDPCYFVVWIIDV